MKTKVILMGLVTCLCLTAFSSSALAQNGSPKQQSTLPPPPTLTVTPLPTPTPTTIIVNAPPPPSSWKTYEYKYGDGEVLSLILPREPQIQVERDKVEQGVEIVSHILTSESPTSVFVAGYIELVTKDQSIKITPEIRKQLAGMFWGFLAQGMQEAMKEMGIEAKLTPSEMKNVSVYGREGQEQDFLLGKMPGRYRTVIAERHIYIILAFSMSNDGLNERDAVIQSFKISPAK